MTFKKIIFLSTLFFAVLSARAQLNPVSWIFNAKKTADKTYELHIKAVMQPGWHLYSQSQPEDAIAIPTSFIFKKNPLLTLQGKTREIGNLEKFHDAKLDLSANQYADSVEFIQVVRLKARAKTNLSGSLEFQTCDNKKCLPPKTIPFSITIQ